MPTQALIRRDPRSTGKGISTRYGFTVIELMITIAVVAIITSLALPSYRTIMEKRQVTSGAEQLGAFLSSAQLESVKRNQFVAVNYQANGGNWCFGMRTGDTANVTCDCRVTDPAAGNACVLDTELLPANTRTLKLFNSGILNHPDVLKTSTVGTNGTIVYDPVRGLTQDAKTVKLEFLSDQSTYALDVDVTVTGRVKICSKKAANKAVAGFKECAT